MLSCPAHRVLKKLNQIIIEHRRELESLSKQFYNFTDMILADKDFRGDYLPDYNHLLHFIDRIRKELNETELCYSEIEAAVEELRMQGAYDIRLRKVEGSSQLATLEWMLGNRPHTRTISVCHLCLLCIL
jgi:hypothetical protein